MTKPRLSYARWQEYRRLQQQASGMADPPDVLAQRYEIEPAPSVTKGAGDPSTFREFAEGLIGIFHARIDEVVKGVNERFDANEAAIKQLMEKQT